jgi:outer membrane putative beta-barrel porin/alpha-amylase
MKRVTLILLFYLMNMFGVQAQELEPRAYLNAPVGLNFVVLGYQYSEGGLIFDPAIDITNANSNAKVGILGYIRTLDIGGLSAKAGVILPYANLYAEGLVSGNFRSREVDGIADPSLYFSINFYGAPALSLQKFRSYKQNMITGFTIKVTPPAGQYEKDKVINIGTNRWSIKPEFGLSKAVNHWLFDTAIAATYYTENDEFAINQTRKQDPIYSIQGNVSYTFKNKVWVSYGVTYYTGGQTSVDGVVGKDLKNNTRTGFIVAIPLNKYHSIKVLASAGLSTRTGTDYNSISAFWQYRWGGGI